MIHFGGCRDGFTSAGYEHGGAFTVALCNAWNHGAFQGSYKDLYRRVVELLQRESQQAQYNEYGPVTAAYRQQHPFAIDLPRGIGEGAYAEIADLRNLVAGLSDRIEVLERREEWVDREAPQKV